MSDATVLTLGYAGRTLADFIGRLQATGTQYVIDVRSFPGSPRQPEFARPRMHGEVEDAGMRYVFLGEELGGRPADDRLYTDGHADYAKMTQAPPFRTALERLARGASDGHGLCIVCVERRPEQCHRAKLISEELVAMGVDVAHIEEGDVPTPHVAVRARFVENQLRMDGLEVRTDISRGVYRDAEAR